MTLIDAILKKVQRKNSLISKASKKTLTSPPPEMKRASIPKIRKKLFKYAHVRASVDSSPPRYEPPSLALRGDWHRRALNLAAENRSLLIAIKRTHLEGGKVDSHWDRPLKQFRWAYESRLNFVKRVQRENKNIYKRIISTGPRVVSTMSLHRDWNKNRKEIVMMAQTKFVLFPPVPQDDIEDPAFLTPQGVKRPRVYMTLRVRGGSELGSLRAELFTDVCPLTCQLFLELLDGDGLGHGYVGTYFFRKVPNLYWSGGDVIYNNGFGCYAQRGRREPIGAENYHFSHSMAGLLSMRVTPDDEMCGIFNITFKPLPQFDLRNVVFGRIVRPCGVFDSIRELGSALSKQPVVELCASRRRAGRAPPAWRRGAPNTKLAEYCHGHESF